MSKRELIVHELSRVPDQDLERLLAFLRVLQEERADRVVQAFAAESLLSRDWLTPEEDVAWADL